MNVKLITLILLAISLNSITWRAFKFNNERTSNIPEICEPPLEVAWGFQIQGEFVSQPITYKNYVYATSREGSIWCWNIKTGELVWQFSTYGPIDASPLAYNDLIYAASTDGNIYAFKYIYQEDEDVLPVWTFDTQSKLRSSPIVYKDKLYILSGHPKSTVYELNPHTGQLLRSFEVSSFGFSSPSIKDDILIIGTNDGKIHFINLQTGNILSYQTLSNFAYTTFPIDETTIFIPTNKEESKTYAFDLTTKLEKFKTGDLLPGFYPSNSSPAILKDNVLVAYTSFYLADTGLGYYEKYDTLMLFALNKNNGKITWNKQIGIPHQSGIISSPSVADETIFIGSADGNLYVLNSNGQVISSVNLDGSPILASPSISNGRVFAGTLSGKFYALKSQKYISISSPDIDDEVNGVIQLRGNIVYFPFTYYEIHYKKSGLEDWTFISSNTTTGENIELGIFDTTKVVDGIYEIRLMVYNPPKSASTKVKINNPPRPPQNLIANDLPEDQGKAILLSWVKSPDDGSGGNDVRGYKIFRSLSPQNYDFSTPFAIVNAGESTFKDDNVIIGLTYYYTIKAFDDKYDSEVSNEASSFSLDNIPPSKPKNLRLTLHYNYILLEWEKSDDDGKNADDVKQYWLFKSTTQGTYNFLSPYKILAKGVTSFIDNDIEIGQNYYYLLKAYDGSNFSKPSNEVSIFVGLIKKKISGTVAEEVKIWTTANSVQIENIPVKKQNIINVNFNGDVVEIIIPAGVIIAGETLTITKIQNLTGIHQPKDAVQTSPVFNFEFKKTDLKDNTQDITIKIFYGNRNFTNEDLLRMYTVYKNKWVMLNTSRLNKDENYVSCTVRNLSYFCVMEFKTHIEPLNPNEVYTYPNPVRCQDALTFKYRLNGFTPSTEIEVYNVAGELIWKHRNTHAIEDIGKTFEIKWQIPEIAPGVYIYKFEAQGLKKTIIKKLAIAR